MPLSQPCIDVLESLKQITGICFCRAHCGVKVILCSQNVSFALLVGDLSSHGPILVEWPLGLA